jgi:hypothetical protein
MSWILRTILLGTLLILQLGGCISNPTNAKDAPATISQEDKELLERIKAKEKAKADLLAYPSQFLVSGGWDKLDRGFFTSYTKATAVEITHHSGFDVSEIEGHFTYLKDDGQELATVPFTAEGYVPAGETRKLKVSAEEVTGAATKGRATVEKIKILGGN